MRTRGGAATATGELCATCGIPLDSRPFDESRFEEIDLLAMPAGEVRSLVSFKLPPRYCGVLRYFAQYTDRLVDWNDYLTPGLEWSLRSNDRPLSPYHSLPLIVNPWGLGSFPVDLRIDEAATLDLVVRRVTTPTTPPPPPPVVRVGGRIVGRYWYNELYGAAGVAGGGLRARSSTARQEIMR